MEEGNKFNSPILFLIFNRPKPTFKVFEAIKKIKPTKLYIAADGPRADKIGELEKCIATREVLNLVDWDCDIKTLFRENNLGCKVAVSSAITWFFENEEEGIILEDDCLPNDSFFYFCSELLDKYRSDVEVMHIGGNNFISQSFPFKESYYFTRYNHIWGWASWSRAWKLYDVDIKEFPGFYKEKKIKEIFFNNWAKYYWLYKFVKVFSGKIDTWDYQWSFAIWKNKGKSISPSVNLVSNIGFDLDGTHNPKNNKLGNLPCHNIGEMVHPLNNSVSHNADNLSDRIVFKITILRKIICFFLVKLVSKKLR